MNNPFASSALTRRGFLIGSGALAATLAAPRLLFASTGGSSRLVVVLLRGALDGLAAAPPYADPSYANLRREIAITAPGGADGALALDGSFGLHPSLAFLHERYLAKQLVVFHAIASPYRERSHFDGQNVLENGLTQPLASADGWLNRAVAAAPARAHGASVERALAVSQNVPLILRGSAPVLAKSPQIAPDLDEDLLVRLADLYSKDDWFSARLSAAVDSEKLGDVLTAAGGMSGSGTANDAAKPRKRINQLSHTAQLAAALMRNENGPDIAVLEATGWDTHANQGGAKGTLATRLLGLDQAVKAFADEMPDLWPRTSILIVTEFGRTAAINGTRGTDHGTGTCCFLVGGAVDGGRVIADWPGLAPAQLLERRDLKPTLDVRSVCKAVLADHLKLDSRSIDSRVFPDSAHAPAIAGLFKS
jgi:uncharacterized protein (DUF1501 family)